MLCNCIELPRCCKIVKLRPVSEDHLTRLLGRDSCTFVSGSGGVALAATVDTRGLRPNSVA